MGGKGVELCRKGRNVVVDVTARGRERREWEGKSKERNRGK